MRLVASSWVCAVLLSAGCGGGQEKKKPPAAETPTTPETTAASEGLDENARQILAALVDLETQRDVTCWTSFRQLDWFIAEKQYDEFGTLAKIRAMKTLVRAVWAKAAEHSPGATVSAADIQAVIDLPDVSLEQPPPGAVFTNNVGVQNFSDYQKTAEHWRLLLGVVEEEILGAGDAALEPMEEEALAELAKVSTTLSLMLLKESGAAAEAAKSPLVTGAHVEQAQQQLAKKYGLAAPAREPTPLPKDKIAARMQPITRDLIAGKAAALQDFNRGSARILEDLNRVSRKPIDEQALQLFQLQLMSFARFVTQGFEPMRADNYLSDGSFAPTKMQELGYVDEIHVYNVITQIFPHHVMPNGDVRVRFEPNPGPVIPFERKAHEYRLLDHEMNGVRDSAIHWLVLADVWRDSPFAIDPFGAEYLSEVVSMMMTLYIRRAEVIAESMGKDTIDVEVAQRVRDSAYVMVPPEEPATATWSEEKKKAKEALLAKYSGPLFADVTKAVGLPTKSIMEDAPLLGETAGGTSLDPDAAGHGTTPTKPGGEHGSTPAKPGGEHGTTPAKPGGEHGTTPAKPGGEHGTTPAKPGGEHGTTPAKPGGEHGTTPAKPGGEHGTTPAKPGGEHGTTPAKPGGEHGTTPAKPGGEHGTTPAKPGGEHGTTPAKPGGEHGTTPTKPGGEHGTTPTKPGGEHGTTPTKSGEGAFNFQTIMGAGIAVGDIDDDGYPDLFLNGEGLGRLYKNRGKAKPGHFTDVTEAWGIPAGINDGHGVLFFDMEGDGDPDLLILRSDNPSLILRHEGGRYVDATADTKITTHRGAHVASIFDADGDGDLDIYIGYYSSHESNIAEGPTRNLPSMDGRNGSPNQLWRRGSDGTYTEEAAAMGLGDTGWTLATGTFDADMDGDLDLYIANDFGANAQFRNDGSGKFTDVTEELGTGDRGSGMNVDFADINGDGMWDIYVTNIDMYSKRIKVVFPRDESTITLDASLAQAFQYMSGNKFYVSTEGGGFSAEEGLRFEPGDRGWGWDAAFFDYENDGDEDLYVTNGWIEGSYSGNQANQLFLNDDGTFYVGPPGSPETFQGNTRSAAAIDIDLDGDVDLVTNQFRQAPRVLRNEQKTDNRWLRVRLDGKGANRSAVGAIVLVKTEDEAWMRQVTCGRGYLSQADVALNFGVGSAEQVDLEIHWPDGSKQTIAGVATNKVQRIAQP